MSEIVTEKQLQEGLQSFIQGLVEFAADTVVINAYGMLDDNASITPICIIANTDSFDNLQAAGGNSVGTITIPATIAVRFDDWQVSLDLFRDTRQAISTLFSQTSGARAIGLEGVMVKNVTSGGAVDYLGLDQQAELPVWITQEINFNVELF